ncbi:MAG: VOC family protein [Rhodospirillaceae bacterium]
MEKIIDNLLSDFEQGKLSRRNLIQSLTIAAASVAGVPALAATSGKLPSAVAVNHISYGVKDYTKVRDFYADLLGMKVLADDGKSCQLAFGDSFLVLRNRAADDKRPPVDHIAYTIDTWDKNAVEAELKRRGFTPRPDTENSFHVPDPEGLGVQISGRAMKAGA